MAVSSPSSGNEPTVTANRIPTAYSSLPDQDYFRTLELYPGAGDDPLQCRLLDVQLNDDDVDYEALSYVWGDVTTTSHVENLTSSTESAFLPVASNLHQAMLALRLTDESRLLWIDALCINQNDTQERSHQVAHMGRIFAQATRVLVWLGPEDDQSSLCVGVIRSVGTEVAKQAVPGMSMEDVEVMTELDANDWELVDAFYSRPWFWRVW